MPYDRAVLAGRPFLHAARMHRTRAQFKRVGACDRVGRPRPHERHADPPTAGEETPQEGAETCSVACLPVDPGAGIVHCGRSARCRHGGLSATAGGWRAGGWYRANSPTELTMPDPIHPGVMLSSVLRERGISQARLARATGLPPSRISELVHCRWGITADMALRLGRALGPSAKFWQDLQSRYGIDRAEQSVDTGAVEPLVTRSPVIRPAGYSRPMPSGALPTPTFLSRS